MAECSLGRLGLNWYSDLSWSWVTKSRTEGIKHISNPELNLKSAHEFSVTSPRMGPSVEFTCVLLTVLTLTKNLLVSGGCSGKCCHGRDLGCFTTDWRMDRVYTTCYCDQDCVKTRDCCFDYFTECPGEGGRSHLLTFNIKTYFVSLLMLCLLSNSCAPCSPLLVSPKHSAKPAPNLIWVDWPA